MVNVFKWLGLVATILAAVVVVLSTVFSIPYTQALINLLVGEFVLLATAHSTYRISSGKQATMQATAVTIVGAAVLAGTPYLLARFDPYLTIQLVCSLVILASGLGALANRYVGGEEGRRSGAERIAARSGN